ncbi:MAG: hypothetical protein ACXAC5_00290 [Promethearchaeota archaeon]|jgi:hypothetical protein
MAVNIRANTNDIFHIGSGLQCGTGQTATLDSSYTYGSSGDTVGYRFQSPVTATLDRFYFYLTTISGLPGDVKIEVRNATSARQAGSTLLASETIAGTANSWHQINFSSPPTLQKHETYFVVIGLTSGSATDYVLLQRGSALCAPSDTGGMDDLFKGFLSTDGFSTNGSGSGFASCGVLKFSDGTLYGHPFVSYSANASNSLERGVKIEGFNTDVSIFGIALIVGATNVSGYKVYDATSNPGDTPLFEHTASAEEIASDHLLGGSFTFEANTTYRLVLKYSTDSTVPGVFEIDNDGGETDLLNAGFSSGTMYHTIDNGAGGWTDEQDKFPRLVFFISSFELP